MYDACNSTSEQKTWKGQELDKGRDFGLLLNCMVKGGCFQKGNKPATCWNLISQEIRKEVGTMLTDDQCRFRYDTLFKAYRITMDYCVKTGKSFSEITEEERIILRLATTLHEDWFMAIDKICHCSPHKAKSHKRVKSTPSVVHGPLPLSSARTRSPLSPRTSMFSMYREQKLCISNSSLTLDSSLYQGGERRFTSTLDAKLDFEKRLVPRSFPF